jgi:hypothetical protein
MRYFAHCNYGTNMKKMFFTIIFLGRHILGCEFTNKIEENLFLFLEF